MVNCSVLETPLPVIRQPHLTQIQYLRKSSPHNSAGASRAPWAFESPRHGSIPMDLYNYLFLCGNIAYNNFLLCASKYIYVLK